MSAQVKNEAGVELGDIFVSSWGYDQTNIDYYKVVGVTPKTIKVVQINKTRTGTSGTSDVVMPDPDSVKKGGWDPKTGEYDPELVKVLTKRVRLTSPSLGSRPSFVVASYANAYKWSGNANHETNALYGH